MNNARKRKYRRIRAGHDVVEHIEAAPAPVPTWAELMRCKEPEVRELAAAHGVEYSGLMQTKSALNRVRG